MVTFNDGIGYQVGTGVWAKASGLRCLEVDYETTSTILMNMCNVTMKPWNPSSAISSLAFSLQSAEILVLGYSVQDYS